MTTTLTGGCLCRAIRYEVTPPTPLTNVVACHCANCRRISGAGSSHNTIIPTNALKFTAGTPKRYEDKGAATGNLLYRFFCGNCGSSIYSQRSKTPEMSVLKVGTLDDASGMKLAMNIWTEAALPWMHVDPAVAQHRQNRPA